MNVLLTGSFGNIGSSVLAQLLRQGHRVRCFDLPTRANRQRARRWQRPGEPAPEVVWGDLRRPADLLPAVQGQDVVIHLAFIIPKMSATGIESERRPDWARAVNVGGTQNLLDAVRALPRPPRFIFASSVHVFGPPRLNQLCVSAADTVNPLEHYSRHKVECEQRVQASGLDWAILRFGATLPLAIQLDPGMFDVPLENRIEFLHTYDAGVAVANAAASPDVWGKILLIAGGPRCQFLYGELVARILTAMGVGMLPESAFSQVPFCTDWMDTRESEALLHYQQRTLDDYIRDMVALLGFRRTLIRLFRPFIRAALLNRSPYYPRGRRRVAYEPAA